MGGFGYYTIEYLLSTCVSLLISIFYYSNYFQGGYVSRGGGRYKCDGATPSSFNRATTGGVSTGSVFVFGIGAIIFTL